MSSEIQQWPSVIPCFLVHGGNWVQLVLLGGHSPKGTVNNKKHTCSDIVSVDCHSQFGGKTGVLLIKPCVEQVLNFCKRIVSVHYKIGIYRMCICNCAQLTLINPTHSKWLRLCTATHIYIQKRPLIMIYSIVNNLPLTW